MTKEDLEWLRDECMGAMFYQSQNTCCNESDRDSDNKDEDRAAALFDELKALIERPQVVNVAVVTDASGETHVRVD